MSDYEMRMLMRELEGIAGTLLSSLIVPIIVAALTGTVLTYCIRWFIFKKAGEQGWKGLIPFYSDYINYKIAWDGKIYLVLLIGSVIQTVVSGIFSLIHPLVGAFFGIVLGTIVGGAKAICSMILQFKFARAFGKNDYFGVGLYFLNSVFTAILAFGDCKYKGVPKDDGIGVPKFLENIGQRPAYAPNPYGQQPMQPGYPMQPQQPVQPGYPMQPQQPVQPQQPMHPQQPVARPVQPQQYPNYRPNTPAMGFQPVQVRTPQVNQPTFTPVQPQQPAPQQPAPQQPVPQQPAPQQPAPQQPAEQPTETL